MISPTKNNASERGSISHNVSCFDDSYNSDDDLSIEQSTHPNKRQKMTEEERLTRCRERNRVHARNTRERKKSQMDGLQSRIQELVDEKKRLNSTASESSVASILMSLAGFEGSNDDMPHGNDGEDNCPVSFSFKVDDDEDDISLSIEKLKMQVSALLGDEDCKDMMDTDPLLAKDKAACSSTELEMIRRERNRMHAKKTRLRKKKMIQEMETIISSLEDEVTALQGGLKSAQVKSEPLFNLPRNATAQMKTASDDTLFFYNHSGYPGDANSNSTTTPTPILIKTETQTIKVEQEVSTPITRQISVDVPSSSSTSTSTSTVVKKRKHTNTNTAVDGQNQNQGRGKQHFPQQFDVTNPSEAGSVMEAQEVRGSQQYLWRQHISKNAPKTVSICSESASGSSEGSVSEGDLSSGSAVHSLLHMSRTNSSDSRGSGSGSDESDTAPSKPTVASNMINTTHSHSRNHTNTTRVEKRLTPPAALTIYPTSVSPCAPSATPKTIQSILAAVESKPSSSLPSVSSTFDASVCTQSHPHWRLPERSSTCPHNLTSAMDVRIAASTGAAVASVYPLTTDAIDDPTSYLAYVPMKAVEAPGPGFQTPYDGVRNHNFTVYGGNRPQNSQNSSNSNNSNSNGNSNNCVSMTNGDQAMLPMKKRPMAMTIEKMESSLRNIPEELDAIESMNFNKLINPMSYSGSTKIEKNEFSDMGVINDFNDVKNGRKEVKKESGYSIFLPPGMDASRGYVSDKNQLNQFNVQSSYCMSMNDTFLNGSSGLSENSRDKDRDREKSAPLEVHRNFIKSEEMKLQQYQQQQQQQQNQLLHQQSLKLPARYQLTPGMLDCTMMRSSEIMPPSL